MKDSFDQRGFSLIEVLLATGVFALFVMTIVGAIIFGTTATELAGERLRAGFLAEEGLEAVLNIRDDDYSLLSPGTHGLEISANQWALAGSSDSSGEFTRQTTLASGGPNRTDVTATVTWQQNPQRSGVISLVTRYTNWMSPVSVVGNWAEPRVEATFDLPGPEDGLKIQVAGNFAYVVRDDNASDFVVIDITSPTAPTIKGTLNLPGSPTNLTLDGGYAYVSSRNNNQELQVVDISNPATPTKVGSFDATGSADGLGIFVLNGFAYLVRASSSDAELMIIDISTPTSLTLRGSLDLGATGSEIWVSGNTAAIASTSNTQELQVVDVLNPASPTLNGSFDLEGNVDASGMTGFGGTAVMTGLGGNDKFNLFDLTNPSTPNYLGTFTGSDGFNDVSLGNNNSYAFLASFDNVKEFHLVDLTNIANPVTISTLNLDASLLGIAYHATKDRAFAVSSDNDGEFVVIAPKAEP